MIDFLFLFPLAVIGIFCSYTDIKYGKIFNNSIKLSFIYIFFLYISLFFYQSLTREVYDIFPFILNGVIAFLLGFLLWHFKLWAAGDAKLFSVYAFLIPLQFYSKSYIKYFPSFNLLVNLFIPILLILIIVFLITLLKEGWKSRYKLKRLKLPSSHRSSQFSLSLFQQFLNFAFVIILLQSFIFLIRGSPLSEIFYNPFFLFALLFLIMRRFQKLKREKRWLNLIIYGVILSYASLLTFLGQIQHLMATLKIALVFMVLIGLTRQSLEWYIQNKETRKIKIKDIKEGMILAKDGIFQVLERQKAKKEEEKLGNLDPGGLKKNQVELIRNLFKNNQELEIGIYKIFPFAPFLFLSATISFVTQSSFLPLISQIFEYFGV